MIKSLVFTGLSVAVAFMPASATIINVPDDYETIQEGIDASTHGDTVRVAEGTYVENINFNGKNIVVGSWFLDAGDPSFISSTIIDGDASGSVVAFENGEDNTAVITGFTIQYGLAQRGGGIVCSGSSPTITNNIISGNTANISGGGIVCSWSSPTISDNTISGNSAIYGGGICCDYNSNPMINYNTIIGNSSDDAGGGILCSDSSPTISDNTITENFAEYNGGGIYCYDSGPEITNTIFWANSAPNGPEIYLDGTSSPVITYCDVQGGWLGEGNIDCDPMFCDPENGNFYLDAASCCVGAGEGGVDIGAFGVGCPMINIPADYETIQEGIDASSNGEIVRVAEGTYVENINFNGKNIVVGSWFLDDGDPSYISLTIIDGSGLDRVVRFSNGETSDAKIIGFTIQNGIAPNGGGIRCGGGSDPTITNNIISENSASGDGGGINCSSSSPTIANNTINGNSAGWRGGGISCAGSSDPTITNNTINGDSAHAYGGGIYCDENSSPTISNNTITENFTEGNGGGICCDQNSNPTINDNTLSGNSADNMGGGISCHNSSPTISNNTISGNSVPLYGGGGGIFCYNSNPTITYNLINGNSAFTDGGGIRCSASSPTISNNTISGNSADEYDGGGISCSWSGPTISNNTISGNSTGDYGGGIYCYESNPDIVNNTITGNTAGSRGGGILCLWNSDPTIINNTISENSATYSGGGIACRNYSSPVITNTILWADSARTGLEIYLDDTSSPEITYCDVQDILWPGQGNISINPLFRNPENSDFHLQSMSNPDCGDPDDSPCIDAGDPSICDIILDCDHGLGEIRSDMGAYGGGEGINCDEIPTLSEWGMIILALLLLTAGTIAVIRRRKAALARTN